MPRLFLDTSIQIQRILGPLAASDAIDRRLARSDVTAVTGHYVLMEYRRSLVADFAHVQRQFVTARTLRDALAWIVSGRRAFRPRSRRRRPRRGLRRGAGGGVSGVDDGSPECGGKFGRRIEFGARR